jgi:glycerol kinase
MHRCILALDQGTTSSRAIVFNASGDVVSCAQQEFEQLYPQPGWVEHDPEAIWMSQLETARQAVAGIDRSQHEIAGIGIANQRETVLIWDRRTGQPIGNAIVWQDRRTADRCKALSEAGHEPAIQQKTGLVLDPYFSASKIAWLLDHNENARDLAQAGRLAFGTIDTWLIHRLTAGKVHATEPTNAARTSLFNLQTHAWDAELFELFDIPMSMAPQVMPSGGDFGQVEPGLLGSSKSLPITGVLGDQQAALYGQRCTQPGLVKNTYGTGCFMLLHTGNQPRPSKHRLLTTTAAPAKPGDGHPPAFALEGSVFVGGAVVQWLRDGLHLIRDSAEVERLAASVPDTGGVVLVPAFAGLGAPHWDPHARGSILGLTRGTTAGHLARAALEGIAYQVADVLDTMQKEADAPIRELRVDGGAAVNDLLIQFQADLLRVPVVRPRHTQTTALGAAMLAGLAAGVWSDEQVESIWQPDRTFDPKMPKDQADQLRGRWAEALRRARDWAE